LDSEREEAERTGMAALARIQSEREAERAGMAAMMVGAAKGKWMSRRLAERDSTLSPKTKTNNIFALENCHGTQNLPFWLRILVSERRF
jgi:hypothetical protein